MFNEKDIEIGKNGQECKVWQTPKYLESRQKAIQIIESYETINEGDFWILMRESKNGKTMMYVGLIISHNGCLKLNEELPKEERFDPACVQLDKEGYGGTLVYHYCGEDLYEVGEVSKSNCKNDYPYAMAFKRCFDRVVLKKTKLAFAGIYSDSEAEEFAEKQEPQEKTDEEKAHDAMLEAYPPRKEMVEFIRKNYDAENMEKLLDYYKVETLDELTDAQVIVCFNKKNGRK